MSLILIHKIKKILEEPLECMDPNCGACAALEKIEKVIREEEKNDSKTNIN